MRCILLGHQLGRLAFPCCKAACRAHKKPWCAAKCPAALMLEGELRQTLKLVNLCCTPLFTGSRLPCIFAELPQPAAFDHHSRLPHEAIYAPCNPARLPIRSPCAPTPSLVSTSLLSPPPAPCRFGTDEDMTAFAYEVHDHLLDNEDADPESDEVQTVPI